MPWIQHTHGAGDFEQAPTGSQPAVLSRIIDLGTSETNFGPKRQLMLTFEMAETMQDGRPFIMSGWYTLSFHEKAKLRQHLESWRGRQFGDDEDFDLETIVGKGALLNIVEGNNGGRPRIDSIAPLPKGLKAPELASKPLVFNFDAPDWDVFNELSERMQERLRQAPEFNQDPNKAQEQAAAEKQFAKPMATDFDDDVPF